MRLLVFVLFGRCIYSFLPEILDVEDIQFGIIDICPREECSPLSDDPE
jgi:hypothetical protein